MKVFKFGGASVNSIERIQNLKKLLDGFSGEQLMIIISAMGKTTDVLVKLAHELSSQPSRREMDMLLATGEQVTIALLSIAIQELGQPAISLTGAQVGIVTEAEHSRARILEIAPDRIERHLKEGKVVVVAGFQHIRIQIKSNGIHNRSPSRVVTHFGVQVHRGSPCNVHP